MRRLLAAQRLIRAGRHAGALVGSVALATVLGAAVLGAPVLVAPAQAQQEDPEKALAAPGSAFNLDSVRAVIARGDAAAAAGNLTQARKDYDQARDATRRLLGFYRDLSGSFRGLDARIPREMDQKGREALETLAQVNLRLAALFRRQNQPEVAVPLLVEVVKVMTPTNEEGRKAYQSLVELGFVSTPYGAPSTPAP